MFKYFCFKENIHLFLCLLISYTTDKLQIFYNKSRPKCNRTAYLNFTHIFGNVCVKFMPAILLHCKECQPLG
nr:MAG TPA: hypothetical protein [Caudoviricetes sp.]